MPTRLAGWETCSTWYLAVAVLSPQQDTGSGIWGRRPCCEGVGLYTVGNEESCQLRPAWLEVLPTGLFFATAACQRLFCQQ